MMRNPVHSRFFSSSAPSPPQKRVARRRKLRVWEHVTNYKKDTPVEVAANKVDVVLVHVPCKRRSRSVDASRLLATTLCTCAEQNVTVGVHEREGRRRRLRTISITTPHVSLLVEASLKANTAGLGSKVS